MWLRAPPGSGVLARRLKRFVIIGGAGSAIYVLATCLLLRGMGLGVIDATGIAFAIVIIFNYVLHYHWTFESDKAHALALPQFIATSLIGFLINYTVIEIGAVWIGFHYVPTQAVAIGLVVTSNFLLGSLWVFRSPTSD
jgi:putative flippase GtrA